VCSSRIRRWMVASRPSSLIADGELHCEFPSDFR
jgi:hypothetical protein